MAAFCVQPETTESFQYAKISYYEAFRQAAGVNAGGILASCIVRLTPFTMPDVVKLTKEDGFFLDSSSRKKTAVFIKSE